MQQPDQPEISGDEVAAMDALARRVELSQSHHDSPR